MAPFVVKDRVIVGASGGEFGIYGYVKGLDLKTGKILWTARNIGPDAEMLAKPGTFKPFYDKGTDLGATSWPDTAYKIGGAPVWGWMSYDPELDLVYYGVGNPAPYNPEQRPGDNKWTGSVLARHPGDGVAGVGLPVHPARQLGLRRRRHHDPGRRQGRRAKPGRRWSRSTRTASSTRSTAPRARCSPRRRTSR